MRKYIFLALLFICLFTSPILAVGGDLGGNDHQGSSDYPYLIEDLADFQAFCNDANYWDSGVYTQLTADIDLNTVGTYLQAPIAGDIDSDWSFDGTAYAGNFDGKGHVIRNLTIEGAHYCGLFGKTDCGSCIKDLGLENVSITSSDSHVAALVGWNYHGRITSCYVTGAVTGNSSVAALVGSNYSGTITNSYAAVVVSGCDVIGVLVGHNYYGIINSCYCTGQVNGNDAVAGLVGYNFYGIINDSYARCSANGKGTVSGLVASNYSGSITNSYATGAAKGSFNIAGLVGYNYYGNVINSYSTGTVMASEDYVGGLAGGNSGNITNSYSTGDVTGNSTVAALVGSNSGTISTSYSTGDVTGNNTVGGLAGSNSGIITNSYITGTVTGFEYYVGNLVGLNSGDITYCFWDIENSLMDLAYIEKSGSYPDYTYTPIYSKAGVIEGKTTFEMQTMSTFTGVGWDFVGEDINGSDDIWQMCIDGIDYPKLRSQLNEADFVYGDGVNLVDFAILADMWMLSKGQTGYNDICDLKDDDIINFDDFVIFADNWF